MLQEGLFSLLSNEASIVAILGAPGSRSEGTTGVFGGAMEEKVAMPALRVFQVTGAGEQTHDFVDPFHWATVQISCFTHKSGGYGEVKTLATAVRRFLDGWHGVLSDGTAVDSTKFENETDLGFDPDSQTFHTALDFKFGYRDVGT